MGERAISVHPRVPLLPIVYSYDSAQLIRLNKLTDAAFNDVAKHDVVWGEKSIPFLGDDSSLPSYHQEHYLSLGLGYLHRFFTASTYDERYQLLDPQLQCLSGFLTAALSEDDLFIEDLTEEE